MEGILLIHIEIVSMIIQGVSALPTIRLNVLKEQSMSSSFKPIWLFKVFHKKYAILEIRTWLHYRHSLVLYTSSNALSILLCCRYSLMLLCWKSVRMWYCRQSLMLDCMCWPFVSALIFFLIFYYNHMQTCLQKGREFIYPLRMIFLLNLSQKQIIRSNMIKPVPIWSGWYNFMLTPGSLCRPMLLSYVVICDHCFIQEGLLFCINYDIESHYAECRFHR